MIKIYLRHLDFKLKECIDVLFGRDSKGRIVYVDTIADADFVCYPVRNYAEFIDCDKSHLVLDCEDRAHGQIIDGTDWWPDRFVANCNKLARTVYLKLQFLDLSIYSTFPKNITVLSLPLLLGGSKFHITDQHDGVGDALFSKILDNSSTIYDRDWCLINSYAPFRIPIATALDPISSSGFLSLYGGSHATADHATVPYKQALATHKRSKVNISTNGGAFWCLKDGEMFSQKSFILRQDHPFLTLNPLTPKIGIHWDSFTIDSLVEKIRYYSQNTTEREQMAAQGFEYWKSGILGGWAEVYTDALISENFGGLQVCQIT